MTMTNFPAETGGTAMPIMEGIVPARGFGLTYPKNTVKNLYMEEHWVTGPTALTVNESAYRLHKAYELSSQWIRASL